MELQHWVEIGGGAAAAVAAGVGAWKGFGAKWREGMQRRASRRKVDENGRIFVGTRHLIREWRVKTGAQRVLCLSARNNGKPWPPDSIIKVSCLDQSVGHEVENTWARWQNWIVDTDYREMLYDLIHADSRGSLLITQTMPHSVLRDAYEGQGTAASVVFPLHWIVADNALVYVSVNFGRDVGDKPLTPDERHEYETQARTLFNQPEEIRRMVAAGCHVWRER